MGNDYISSSSLFSQEELESIGDDKIQALHEARENTSSRLIDEMVKLCNQNDDYLNPKLRSKTASNENSSEQDLEQESLEFFQRELSTIYIAIEEASKKKSMGFSIKSQ